MENAHAFPTARPSAHQSHSLLSTFEIQPTPFVQAHTSIGIDLLFYLGAGRGSLHAEIESESSLMLIGGAPFAERIIVWWNFVGGSWEEIAAAREDWERKRRFGEVRAYRGKRLTAPRFELRPKLG